jgi:hypothetical protein
MDTSQEEEFLDPKVDFLFKQIFGHDQENFINLTSEILNFPEDKGIKSVEFINSQTTLSGF